MKWIDVIILEICSHLNKQKSNAKRDIQQYVGVVYTSSVPGVTLWGRHDADVAHGEHECVGRFLKYVLMCIYVLICNIKYLLICINGQNRNVGGKIVFNFVDTLDTKV